MGAISDGGAVFDIERVSQATERAAMFKSWAEIGEFYRSIADVDLRAPSNSDNFNPLATLSDHIAEHYAGASFYGWTSHAVLCISQNNIDVSNMDWMPYLRISQLQDGFEFRYVDTPLADRQWARVVRGEQVIPQFDRLVEQLRWVGRTGPAVLT